MTENNSFDEIKNLLPRTWNVFFGRHGRLTEVQKRVIPVIVSGKNCIISSPTASGKTESVFAPIAENLLKESKNNRISAVYIAPTRALINDMKERLEPDFEALYLKLGTWTADHHSIDFDKPPDLVLLTPESLDSLLCRRSELFNSVRYMILDELHLLYNSIRGDQLNILCRRVAKISSEKIKYYALSATISFESLSDFNYFHPYETITVPGTKAMDFKLIHMDKDLFPNLLKEFRSKDLRKVLIFVNSRRTCENVAQKLKQFVDSRLVFVHHGSLDKKRREETERAFKSTRFAYCVSTNSLEVGIDIGDVDAVVLFGPPQNVSSLLQRVGRGNRRVNKSVSFGIYSNDIEHSFFISLYNSAISGELEETGHDFCTSAIIQQIISILYQLRNVGIGEIELYDFLVPSKISPRLFGIILRHMQSQNFAVNVRQLWYPSEKTIRMGDHGFIHSNINENHGYKVVDSYTGQSIGEVGYLDSRSKNFILNGEIWQVKEMSNEIISVSKVGVEAGETKFTARGSTGKFSYLIPKEEKEFTRC